MAVGTEAMLHQALFGERPSCEALVAETGGRTVAFALFFTTFSTFLCKPGIYLEDIFVEPEQRGTGIGKAVLKRLAALVMVRRSRCFDSRLLDWPQSPL